MVLENLPLILVLAGIVLMVLEALAPGANFIVVGVAVLAAGLVGLLVGSAGLLTGGALVALLAALTIIFGSVALYVYREFEFYDGGDSGATSDSASLRGKTGRVTERVTETDGRVKLDEGGFSPVYQARAIDGEIPEGERVFVVDPGGGNVLTVESLGAIERDEIDRALEQEEESEYETN
ncbi:NfeD family protein [Salinarchaeum sp. IM2453]|uniref:NfeD family protein n=1 Tax=Salinarchaeum sp. IM2453 TaxID=2862870 RepID=UPI001C836B93|nr:NfeD family protein [Salinarchaeum sp. IM2453]QZA89016.1 NfeD family protein [Salinarchaeum sp. IM2453]